MKETGNREIFNRYGIKNTRQRNIIFNILKKANSPLTAEQIFLECKKIDDSMSFSTVYRILNTFILKDMVVKTSITEDNKSMFELNHEEHKHYLVCVSCSKMITIGHCPIEDYENSLQKTTDFDITGHKLEVYGYCPQCKNKK